MTQQELADKANVDIKTLYNLESGTRWPIARTRSAISAALEWEGDALTQIAGGAEPGASSGAAPVPRLLRPVTSAPADESGELAAYLPVIQERLKDLAEAGDPLPTGEDMFDPGTDPLGAGPDMAARLVAAWNIALAAPVPVETAAELTARAWVRVLEYRAREAARRRGQSGALSRT